jgi:hypothetical protein
MYGVDVGGGTVVVVVVVVVDVADSSSATNCVPAGAGSVSTTSVVDDAVSSSADWPLEHATRQTSNATTTLTDVRLDIELLHPR